MKKKLVLMTSALMTIGLLAGCGDKNSHEHTWGTPTYTWSDDYSTCTAIRVCAEDSTHKEEETANSVYTETAPTCEDNGEGKYTVAFTNEAFESQSKTITLEAIGHSWGEPTYTWASDYSTCTAERVCLNDATHIESETVDSISEETPATYVSTGSIKYTANFEKAVFSTQIYEITLDKLPYHGEVPILSEDGKTITYGLYPQTNVDDSTLVSALDALTTPESNGWYLYESEYYAKVSATPYNSSYVFDNGTTIVYGTTYWFKCEPITWNVLSNNDGEYFILSSVLLDTQRYGASSNNYANSEIRSWLNNDFYNSAFALGNSHIQTTTVDNSAATTNSSSNSYASNNTQDKVFLPSYQDYINSSYGFSTSADSTDTRYCKTTDWARARRSYCYANSGSYQYNGYYWTRSPSSDYSTDAWDVRTDGRLNGNGYVEYTNRSVRPALSIKIA